MEAPSARHFFVQSAAEALAPFAPHLESLIQPLTVSLLPMSSANAAPTSRNATHAKKQITSNFFMDDSPCAASSCGISPLGRTAGADAKGPTMARIVCPRLCPLKGRAAYRVRKAYHSALRNAGEVK